MNDDDRRYRLLLRLTLDELEELAATARLRGAAVLSTARRTDGDLASAGLEARQLAVVAAEIGMLAERLIEAARKGTLVEVADGLVIDD